VIRAAGLVAVFLVAGGAMAEVPMAYHAPQWRLLEVNGERFGVDATIDLSTAGQVSGHGPCNIFSGAVQGTLPEFRPGPLRVTRRACPDLKREQIYLDLLSRVVRADVLGGDLLLSTGDGVVLRFIRPLN
jgi:heat shock protein HslJ